MTDHLGAIAVLEAALQSAVDGLVRAKSQGDTVAMMAFHEVLGSACNVAEALDYTLPGELAKIDPDALAGMGPRNA